MQPTAQAVGRKRKKEQSPIGAKDGGYSEAGAYETDPQRNA